MVSVLRNISGLRTVRRCRVMALKAEDGGGSENVGVVVRAVDIMATETSDATRVHRAGHEIIALHPVPATRSVGIG